MFLSLVRRRHGLILLSLAALLLLPSISMALLPVDQANRPVFPAIEETAAEAGIRGDPASLFPDAPDVKVLLSQDGERVLAVEGTLSAPSLAQSDEVAGRFMRRFTTRLGLVLSADSSFTQRSIRRSGGWTHAVFGETIDGVPVFGAGLGVHVAGDGTVRALEGTWFGGGEAVNTKRLSAGEARSAAAEAVGMEATAATAAQPSEPEHVFYPAKDGLRHAYLVELDDARTQAAWTVVVDAANGTILAGRDENFYATGHGSLYRRSPLQGEPETFTLRNMDDSKKLWGQYCKAMNEDEDEAMAEDRNYIYEPDNTHFDEVMVYYHVNEVHDYFKRLGFNALDWAMKATVHVGTDFDNAYFSPRGKTLNFGDGNRLNDLAKDDTVIYHEYTHAVTNEMTSMWGGHGGAMHEGYSDYFAGTMTGDPEVGKYAAERLPRGNIRNMENDTRYPEDANGEVHKAGMVWGGVCWDLRKKIGAVKADPIIHLSRNYIGRWMPKMQDAYLGIRKADKQVNNGANLDDIDAVFTNRGFTAPDEALVSIRDLRRGRTFRELLAND